jgi:plastocyanin
MHSCFFVAIPLTLIALFSGGKMFSDTSAPNTFKPSIIVDAVAFDEVFFERTINHTITCTIDDLQPHTATSGEKATRDGRFDSCILATVATFEHTFKEAGEYPCFCILHPNMVEQSA